MLPKMTLVLGGAASGKSLWAENLLLSSRLAPVYLATSRVFDDEIKLKIDLHRSRRNDRWHTIEADSDIGTALVPLESTQAVLIDCATMWLSNRMMDDHDLDAAQGGLLSALGHCAAPTIVVSNEVGQSIVPDNALARRFREAQGRLNIALAQQADLVVFVTAGLPQVLKGDLP
ncbi:bifunctional adenosylcobinamide kinase/adenosylcobinamide-phosphate guanylyltransferase [Roseobacter weihaiensis]|uniref:bifunctional adenosylcobinamide kinase/adenosylcobinamide-phosphate guanylyltransferase n=1 Tax=Roseobacter weihaiensis TaxID=2763262 RepID=UPI001D0B74B7|nr:bifunctional adenosylcobinamide kinase/adenosylcobinamide-phosphate guanylyltransferase [Roseobacter sp. H9]